MRRRAKRGELRQRYHQGQEDQLGALGLVVNVIALWNTLYLDAALAALRAEGYPVCEEEVVLQSLETRLRWAIKWRRPISCRHTKERFDEAVLCPHVPCWCRGDLALA